MDGSQDVLRLLKSYTRRTGSPRIGYLRFAEFAARYMEKYAEEHPDYNEFATHTAELLPGILGSLEKEDVCSLAREGEQITTIIYNQYYLEAVQARYARLEKQPDFPFPTEDSIEAEIPVGSVTPVDVTAEFISWIARSRSEPTALLRLLFPEGIHSIIVPSDLVPRKLAEFAVLKIRNYLRTSRNASYMHQKLLSLLRQRDYSLKDAINAVLATPDQAMVTIFEPNDFTFQFWTQLSTNIIREFAPKVDKMAEEHSYLQAAYLLGYYNVYFRGIQQKNQEKEMALKQFELKLKKKPYAFTLGDMYKFTDARGVLLSKKYPLEAMHDLLTRKTMPLNETGLPEIVRLRTAQKKDFYVAKEFILPLFAERLFLMSKILKEHYAVIWSEALKQDQPPKAMTEDAAFEEDVRSEVAQRDALFFAMLNYNLLFLCKREAGIGGNAASEVNRFFDKKEPRLRSLPELLGLERQRLRQDALLLLPFWQAIPLFRAISRFFRKLMFGRSSQTKRLASHSKSTHPVNSATDQISLQTARMIAVSPEDKPDLSSVHTGDFGGTTSATAHHTEASRTRKAQAAAFHAAIRKLEQSFVPAGQTRDSAMKLLAEKWNPLLEPTAKQNLVEDVNALVRDYLRRIRSGFRIKAPDAQRIRNMARELCDHEALQEIKKAEPLRQYVELYMLKLLGK